MKGYYTSMTKKKPYLYEATYDDLDYDKANGYFKWQDNKINLAGMCSSVRSGNFYGRNYDWFYNNQAEFVIKTPQASGRYASIGVAGSISELTDEFVNSGQYSDLYFILPFYMQDGINEHGLVCNINVVPTDKGTNKTVATIKKKHEICATMLVRFILDHFKTAADAASYIRDYVSVYFPENLHYHNYETHYMIGDKYSTCVVEFVNNETVIIDITYRPYMTNFHLYGVNVNPDGTVYTPQTSTNKKNALISNGITPNGSGLERYNLIAENFKKASLNSRNGMRKLMNELFYSKTYTGAHPFWYTEFVGEKGLNVTSSPKEFLPVVDAAKRYFSETSRDDGKMWHTVHSSVYDMNKKELQLVVQEDGEELIFKL